MNFKLEISVVNQERKFISDRKYITIRKNTKYKIKIVELKNYHKNRKLIHKVQKYFIIKKYNKFKTHSKIYNFP